MFSQNPEGKRMDLKEIGRFMDYINLPQDSVQWRLLTMPLKYPTFLS